MTRTCAGACTSRYLIDDNMAARGKGLDKVTCYVYGSSVLLQLQASQLARLYALHILLMHAAACQANIDAWQLNEGSNANARAGKDAPCAA